MSGANTASGESRSPLNAGNPTVAAVVLAAGTGSRMTASRPASETPGVGELNKLLCRIDGVTLLRKTCATALASHLSPVVVVLGHEAEALEAEISDLAVVITHNADFATGQASSVRTAVRALESAYPEVVAAVFIPADQPALDRATLEQIAQRFRAERPADGDGATIVAPRFGDQRGAPVLFSRHHFRQLLALSGDEGGRQILRDPNQEVSWVDLPSGLPLLDADTTDELSAICEQMGARAELAAPRP